MYPFLGFFLLNYMAAFITWYKLEKNKIFTFAFPILNLYPIYGKGCPEKTLFAFDWTLDIEGTSVLVTKVGWVLKNSENLLSD